MSMKTSNVEKFKSCRNHFSKYLPSEKKKIIIKEPYLWILNLKVFNFLVYFTISTISVTVYRKVFITWLNVLIVVIYFYRLHSN